MIPNLAVKFRSPFLSLILVFQHGFPIIPHPMPLRPIWSSTPAWRTFLQSPSSTCNLLTSVRRVVHHRLLPSSLFVRINIFYDSLFTLDQCYRCRHTAGAIAKTRNLLNEHVSQGSACRAGAIARATSNIQNHHSSRPGTIRWPKLRDWTLLGTRDPDSFVCMRPSASMALGSERLRACNGKSAR
jgi:hypothetical protein